MRIREKGEEDGAGPNISQKFSHELAIVLTYGKLLSWMPLSSSVTVANDYRCRGVTKARNEEKGRYPFTNMTVSGTERAPPWLLAGAAVE